MLGQGHQPGSGGAGAVILQCGPGQTPNPLPSLSSVYLGIPQGLPLLRCFVFKEPSFGGVSCLGHMTKETCLLVWLEE